MSGRAVHCRVLTGDEAAEATCFYAPLLLRQPATLRALASQGLAWIGERVLMRSGIDGPDYARVCERHGWLSAWFVSLDHYPECPECEAERDAGKGRRRFADLIASLRVSR